MAPYSRKTFEDIQTLVADRTVIQPTHRTERTIIVVIVKTLIIKMLASTAIVSIKSRHQWFLEASATNRFVTTVINLVV